MQELVEFLVLPRITQIRHTQPQLPPARAGAAVRRTMRMGAAVGRHETLSLRGEKVAALKDALEVICGDRYAVLRVGDLRNEAAILAQPFGQTLAGSSRPTLQHLLQYALVVGHCGVVRHCAWGSILHAECPSAEASLRQLAMAALTPASAAGATDRLRKPI